MAGAGALLRPAVGHGFPAPAGREGERVFTRRVGALSGVSVVIRPGRRFALAGVQWSSPASGRIELRTRVDGGAWSPWALASVQGHAPDGWSESGPRFGEPVWSGGADELQLRSARPTSGVAVHFVARADGDGAFAATAALASHAAEGIPLAQPVLSTGPGQPPIIARSLWAGDRAPPKGPTNYGSVQLAFVHHTDNPNGYGAAEVPALLLAMFDYHRYVRGFFDIAYNFIVDAFGRIWEARAGGIDEPVVGAHAGGYNQVSTGVAVLGTFVSSVPSPAALDAVEHLLAWKLALHGVPALGKVGVRVSPASAFYTPFRPGQLVRLHRVAGHREGDSTDCPGNAFSARLPSMRPTIAGLAGTPLKLTLTADHQTVAPGTVVALAGSLAGLQASPAVAAPVEIQTVSSGVVTTIATVTTDAGGRFTLSLPVTQTINLRALYQLTPAAVSDVVTVGVAPVLTLALVSSSPARVGGTVTPAKPRVTIDTYRVSGGRRHLLASHRVSVHQGRFSARVPLGTFRPPARPGGGDREYRRRWRHGGRSVPAVDRGGLTQSPVSRRRGPWARSRACAAAARARHRARRS